MTDLPLLETFIQAMPKSELHVHLEGTVKPATLLQLAHNNGLQHTLPSTSQDGLQEWFTFRDFPHFVEVILAVQNLLRTKEDFALAAYENGATMCAQNIRYRELTVSPFNHTTVLQKDLTIEDILYGLEEGRRQARADFGVEMRWVFDIARNFCFAAPNTGYDPFPAQETLRYATAGQAYGVIALGLGGAEVGCPPEPFAPTFARAKEAGLYSVPHAGETVGPASVWGAAKALQADRLGHGVRAIEDPQLLAWLHEHQIPLEICLSSNSCLHVYDRIEGHPLPHLDRMGLPVTINTDDPPLFNTTLCDEYRLLAECFDYDQADIARIARNAFVYSLAEPALKAALLSDFDAWLQSQEAS